MNKEEIIPPKNFIKKFNKSLIKQFRYFLKIACNSRSCRKKAFKIIKENLNEDIFDINKYFEILFSKKQPHLLIESYTKQVLRYMKDHSFEFFEYFDEKLLLEILDLYIVQNMLKEITDEIDSNPELIRSILNSKYFDISKLPDIKDFERFSDIFQIWKKSKHIEPIDIMGYERGSVWGGFSKKYFNRNIDSQLSSLISNFVKFDKKDWKHIIIVGRPLSGKSRLIYESIRKQKLELDILKPYYKNINSKTISLLDAYKTKSRKVVVLDDIHRYLSLGNFERFLKSILIKDNLIILLTCRSGTEFEIFIRFFQRHIGIPFNEIFDILKIEAISFEEAKLFAEEINKSWVDIFYDGTIGSIFLPINEMYNRYKKIDKTEKTFLKAIKIAYLAGLYEGKLEFPTEWIYKILKNINSKSLDNFKLENAIISLKNNDFILEINRRFIIEEIYLEKIIEPGFEISINMIDQLLELFNESYHANLSLIKHLLNYSERKIKKIEYIEFCIKKLKEMISTKKLSKNSPYYGEIVTLLGKSYQSLAEFSNPITFSKEAIQNINLALEVFTYENSPLDFANLNIDLGNAYHILAEYENKEENSLNSIKAYEHTLRVFKQDMYFIDYIITQANIGNAYQTLAEINNPLTNSMKAIKVLSNILNEIPEKQFTSYYIKIKNNLGNAYQTLANFKDPVNNFRSAIITYQDAIDSLVKHEYPLDYGKLAHNIGICFSQLAEILNPIENSEKAIKYLNESLFIYKKVNSVTSYARVCFDLGIVQRKLADLLKSKNHYMKAISSFEDSLKIFNIDSFPNDYGKILINLGSTFLSLAELEENKGNIILAINSINSAIEILDVEKDSFVYAQGLNNLGNAYMALVEIDESSTNLIKAIESYMNALNIFNLKESILDSAMVQMNLGNAYNALSEIQNEKENLQKSIYYLKKAEKIYDNNNFTYDYAKIKNNLGNVYSRMSEIEKPISNLNKALHFYDEASRIWTINSFPFDYAKAQYNKGLTYHILSEYKDSINNLKNAVSSFEEASLIWISEKFPSEYIDLIINQGWVYVDLAELENTLENYNKAITNFLLASHELKKMQQLYEYANVLNDIGNVCVNIADFQQSNLNYEKAIAFYQKSLDIYTQLNYSRDYSLTLNNLGSTYAQLAEKENSLRYALLATDKYIKSILKFKEITIDDDTIIIYTNLNYLLSKFKNKIKENKQLHEAYYLLKKALPFIDKTIYSKEYMHIEKEIKKIQI